ncbi:hypothetical protein ACHQM5_024945 [Ranunculus cassubicifolius]
MDLCNSASYYLPKVFYSSSKCNSLVSNSLHYKRFPLKWRHRNLVTRSRRNQDYNQNQEIGSSEKKLRGAENLLGLLIPIKRQENEKNEENLGIVAACFVGLLTGIAVVLFNTAVHEILYIFWEGVPSQGTSWLRDEPIQEKWKQVVLIPVCGGIIVSVLNTLGAALEVETSLGFGIRSVNVRDALKPLLKALAAAFTLGTGNSLGPEGPSVEIGASLAKGISSFFARGIGTRVSLIASGSAAGFSSGFNAAVAGCFFAVESVLRPSPVETSSSLTNTTSMVILSAVLAAVVSQVGLGSEPAFKVPEYDFRSPTELPLYLLLGILCGLVSITLTRCTSYAFMVVDIAHKEIAIPKPVFPVLGGLTVGLIALAYPEILYRGFENVDILLESQPLVKGLPADLLLQLVGVKILATSFCRASGLVGGYYAPSLFIGAATGMAYGKFISYAISLSDPMFHLTFLEVASPQAYGLVGMAATLAGVCQVPLTSVLLLFELTQDYRIVLPLLGAVGLSSLIASGGQTREKDVAGTNTSSSSTSKEYNTRDDSSLSEEKEPSDSSGLCELESSLCIDDSFDELENLEERMVVSEAMQTRYVSVLMTTLLSEAVSLMLSEKQSCALIVDHDNLLVDFVTLGDIQEFCKFNNGNNKKPKVERPVISEIYKVNKEKGRLLWTATQDMKLISATSIMNKHGLDQLPVVSEHVKAQSGYPIGVLDRECINLACRAVATQEFLTLYSELQGKSLNDK